MIGERELELLSAYSDGELPPEQRPAVEALLNDYPHLAEALKEFRRLNDAARAEAVPSLPGAAEHWDSTRAACGESVETQQRQKIKQVALSDDAPAVEGQRFDRMWTRIQARTVLNPRVSRRSTTAEIPPRVQSRKWNSVWESIAGQTQPSPTTHISKLNPGHAIRWRFWGLATASALVAGVLVMVLFRGGEERAQIAQPRTAMTLEPGGEMSGLNAVASVALPAFEVPDALDERYGVAVKYNPGDNNPVIHLYLKNANESEVRSTESAVPAQ